MRILNFRNRQEPLAITDLAITETPEEAISDFQEEATKYAYPDEEDTWASTPPMATPTSSQRNMRKRNRAKIRLPRSSPKGVVHNVVIEAVLVWPGFWTMVLVLTSADALPVVLIGVMAVTGALAVVIFLNSLQEALRQGIVQGKLSDAADYVIDSLIGSRKVCTSVLLSLAGLLFAYYVILG